LGRHGSKKLENTETTAFMVSLLELKVSGVIIHLLPLSESLGSNFSLKTLNSHPRGVSGFFDACATCLPSRAKLLPVRFG
jgi:hypothetical protein